MDPRPDLPAWCLTLTLFAVVGCPISSYHDIRCVHLLSRGNNLLVILSTPKTALGLSILWWQGVVGNLNIGWMLVALKEKFRWSAVSPEGSGLHGVQCPAHTTASLAMGVCLHGSQGSWAKAPWKAGGLWLCNALVMCSLYCGGADAWVLCCSC